MSADNRGSDGGHLHPSQQRRAPALPVLSISVVMAARNDDHGGNMLQRMRLAIDTLGQHCREYRLGIELIVVEWNPPDDRAPLGQALDLNSIIPPPVTRFIVVPAELHARFPEAEHLPLFQYAAKNVGIRRARSDWVLATNMDILLSNGVAAFLARGQLHGDRFYRADRCDVPANVPLEVPLEERLAYCSAQATQVYEHMGTRKPIRGGALRRTAVAAARNLRDRWAQLKPNRGGNYGLHTNACGDFVLMSGRHWHRLRGYPELPSHAYVDGLVCYQAACSGLTQVRLGRDRVVYHVAHECSWSDMSGGRQKSYRPSLDYAQYRRWCEEMMAERVPLMVNTEDWGLGPENLEEY